MQSRFSPKIWIAWTLFASTSASVFALTAQASCPLTDRKAWQEFIETAADHPKWVETCEDSACDANFYAQVEKNVQSVLKSCGGTIASDPGLARCTENLRKFTPAWMRQHDGDSYGFNVTNAVYLGGQDGFDKPPGMMKIPDEIVRALPDQTRVQEIARRNGWKYLTHDSAIHGVRTFVYIPSDKFDQWMLLNLNGPGDKKISKTMPVSLVTVQKQTADGRPLDRIRLHFRDYAVESRGSHVQLAVNPTGNGKCYGCHASGMRQLISQWTPVTQALPVKGEAFYGKKVAGSFGFRRLQEFNRIIRRYGTVDWNGMIDPEAHGPALGLRQGCVSCHNGISRGALTVSTSIVQLRRKMVIEQSMPPMRGSTDSHSNEALAAEFMASRFPELKRWLLEKPCL